MIEERGVGTRCDGMAACEATVDGLGMWRARRKHWGGWCGGLYYHKPKPREGFVASLCTIVCIQATLNAENAVRRGIMQAYNA